SGSQSLTSASTQITTGYATLSGVNYNRISWTAVPGAASYDVVRVSGGSPTSYSLLGNTAGTSLNDIGQSTSSYPSTCASYTDLRIQSPASGTQVVNMNTLTMGLCSRVTILGSGTVDLRIGAATGTSLSATTASGASLVRFGASSSDTWS